ncbi:hypothetical protein CBR_g30763 [Chara braunii]|uniref:Chlorophyll(Ide) b reductase n=1 Tax=Chara braunii TaxID=69332 RepID=A0A388JXJ9_CHABU|nr:hypothetical protein CBR_g30763 [Chara braunii]|eukprot:GBG62443.1 hypothetical protein CBR_g30763 [Chara braunii]
MQELDDPNYNYGATHWREKAEAILHRGVGYALAKEFLQAGDNVIICSRSGDRVEQVCKELKEQFGDKRVWGTACNVADAKDVEKLALFANEKLGYVDLWINNAGTNGYEAKALIDTSDEVLTEVVATNMLGVIICCREAKFFVNVLAEPAATVADYLVPRLRKVPTTAGGQSTYIRFLTKPRAYFQIILRLLFKLRKDRYVKEDS